MKGGCLTILGQPPFFFVFPICFDSANIYQSPFPKKFNEKISPFIVIYDKQKSVNDILHPRFKFQ